MQGCFPWLSFHFAHTRHQASCPPGKLQTCTLLLRLDWHVTWAQAAPPPSPSQPDQKPDAGAFPPMSGDDVQRYQGLFARLDADRDGYVLVRQMTAPASGSTIHERLGA